MQKGFGDSIKKKSLKDIKYLRFHNDEKIANNLLRNKNTIAAKKIYIKLLNDGYQNFDVLFNLGFIELSQKKYKDAINYLTKAKLLSKKNNLKLIFGMVNCLLALKDFDKARFILDEAIENDPKEELLIFNYAKVEEDLLNFNQAIELYERGLKIDPNNFKALSNLGGLYQKIKNYPSAIEVYKKAINLQPNISHLKVSLLTSKAFACDWSDIQYTKDLLKRIDLEDQSVCPFELLPLEDNPKNHLKRSKKYFHSEFERKSKNVSFIPKTKIRIGYFSADFFKHATMFLMRRIFELHDKSKFEIFIYSFSNKQDDITDELKNNVDKFTNISNLSDEEAVYLVRKDGIDIAVDLKGFTKNTRLSIFSLRVAPIQISYLGYPGTIGSSCIDYIIADKIVIPEIYKKYYSEKVVYMPDCYQCNDNLRAVSKKIFKKSDLGLNDDNFIFACFNANNKISSEEFDIWMNILKRIDNSILWLYKSNDYSEINLKKESEKRGVESSRIIFADRVPNDLHLSRIKCADLFLDTFNYNAHTTASDALWANIPIITRQGKSFSARVCSSLLKSLELDELIVKNNTEYEEKALFIAKNKNYLKELKFRLNQNKLKSSLFDSEKFTRNLEKLYLKLIKGF